VNRALCLIRDALVYRRAAFVSGLQAAGYAIATTLPNPDASDVLVIWNRYGDNETQATRFERAGARVLVIENGYLGKSWLGDRWFAMAVGQHAGGGKWNVGGNERWDSLNVPLAPWRTGGTETVILAQRGIGSQEVKSPDNWAQSVQKRIGGRVRAHPGKKEPEIPLEQDLFNASCVVTWASTAAFQALMLGIPVWYDYPKWIGAIAAYPLLSYGEQGYGPRRDDEDRVQMFRNLMWAMWRASEIEDGTAFRHLLGS
jgi:hypothetical protein